MERFRDVRPPLLGRRRLLGHLRYFTFEELLGIYPGNSQRNNRIIMKFYNYFRCLLSIG